VQTARITLTCLAFNTAQVYLSRRGKSLAAKGIRRLRRTANKEHGASPKEHGASPIVVYVNDNFGVFSVKS